MTFEQWMKRADVHHLWVNLWVKDFIGDALRDWTFPRGIKSWKRLHTYLMCQGACDEAIEGGKAAWRYYKQDLKEMRKS
jgi:YozE SAM-like fold